jgi:hypothetical protein
MMSNGSSARDDSLPKRKEMPHRMAGDEMLITDPATGQVHFLNATAAAIWQCCDGACTLTDCEDQIRGAFAPPEDVDVCADIREVLVELDKKGLLEA